MPINSYRLRLFVALVFFALASSTIVFLFHRIVRAQSAPADPATSGIDVVLIPSKPTVVANSPVDVEVWVFPNGNQVTAAELRVNFNPAILTPRTATPFVPGPALNLVLPNCDAAQTNPCMATSSATPNQALVYLSVACTQTGCPIPNTAQKFLLATLNLQAAPTATGVTNLTLNDPQKPTLTAALAFDGNATKILSNTSLTVSPCNLAYDFSPNAVVDIVDIMQAAAHWNSGAGNPLYNGQFDVNRDGQIDIVDIQTIANTWNTSCTH